MDKPFVCGIKLRAYPTPEQIVFFDLNFEACRLANNLAIEMWENAYQAGEKCGYNVISKQMTKLKKTEEYNIMKEADAVAIQQSVKNVDRGYQNYFQFHAEKPKIKEKRHKKSYRTYNQGNSIRIENNRVRLPKIGEVKVKIPKNNPRLQQYNHISYATVTKTSSGKYFITLNVEFEPENRVNEGGEVGIDTGIKYYFTESNGKVVANPRFLEKELKKLAIEKSKRSKMQKGSNNFKKQNEKIAKIYEKISGRRNQFLHEESARLLRENQTICIEDMGIHKLITDNQGNRYSTAISSAGWGKFYRMLNYKAAWYGNDVIKIPKYYPSSQICSVCGYKNPEIKDPEIRVWKCGICGTEHNRDLNAAINILKKGLESKDE